MGRKRHTPEEINGKPREAEGGGDRWQTIPQAYRRLGPPPAPGLGRVSTVRWYARSS
jgi:hypothetical protein